MSTLLQWDDKSKSMEMQLSTFKNEVKSQVTELSARISAQDQHTDRSKQELLNSVRKT